MGMGEGTGMAGGSNLGQGGNVHNLMTGPNPYSGRTAKG